MNRAKSVKNKEINKNFGAHEDAKSNGINNLLKNVEAK